MIGTICHQLTDNATPEQLREAGMDAWYIDHGLGIHPSGASGMPWTGAYVQSKGDPITDLYENMAADGAILKEQQFKLILISNKVRIKRGLVLYREKVRDYYKIAGQKTKKASQNDFGVLIQQKNVICFHKNDYYIRFIRNL